MPTRRQLLAAPFLALPSRAAARRPNVVLFMTDDHGAWANGCYGCSDIHTPHIDALAALQAFRNKRRDEAGLIAWGRPA